MIGMAVVRILATQPYAEGSGHRSLALPRVRTGMLASVASPDLFCACGVPAPELRGGYNSGSRQTRRDEVHCVVEPRSHASEIAIRRVPMTNHGIERVDRFIGHGARNAPGRQPEQGSHDA